MSAHTCTCAGMADEAARALSTLHPVASMRWLVSSVRDVRRVGKGHQAGWPGGGDMMRIGQGEGSLDWRDMRVPARPCHASTS